MGLTNGWCVKATPELGTPRGKPLLWSENLGGKKGSAQGRENKNPVGGEEGWDVQTKWGKKKHRG